LSIIPGGVISSGLEEQNAHLELHFVPFLQYKTWLTVSYQPSAISYQPSSGRALLRRVELRPLPADG